MFAKKRLGWLKKFLPAMQTRKELVILDNIFPHLLSAFRIAEYNAYLERFGNAKIYSTATAFAAFKENRSFSEVRAEYEGYYPQFKERVFEFSPEINFHNKLVFTIFIDNISNFIEIIDRHQVPFVYTLYPGGGFRLDQEESDNKLRRVFSSPNFRKVITTQKLTYDYLLEKKFCAPDQVGFIYGCVVPSDRLQQQVLPKKYYQQDKDTFDICFVAYKYTEKAVAHKGYDVFTQVARCLVKMHPNIRFHVVGSFYENDIDVNDLKDRLKFYGTQNTDFFSSFYASMDIILSPNMPFAMEVGSFDGFPTGACMEAGLCGVAVFCTDILNLNVAFKNNEEIVIISRNFEEISDLIAYYYDNSTSLYELAGKGQAAFARVFNIQTQMEPRLQILSEYLR